MFIFFPTPVYPGPLFIVFAFLPKAFNHASGCDPRLTPQVGKLLFSGICLPAVWYPPPWFFFFLGLVLLWTPGFFSTQFFLCSSQALESFLPPPSCLFLRQPTPLHSSCFISEFRWPHSPGFFRFRKMLRPSGEPPVRR